MEISEKDNNLKPQRNLFSLAGCVAKKKDLETERAELPKIVNLSIFAD